MKKKVRLNFLLNIYDEQGCLIKRKIIIKKVDKNERFCEVLDNIYYLNRISNGPEYGWYIRNFVKIIWKKYFNSNIYDNLLINYKEYANAKLYQYDHQFNISKKIIIIDIDPLGWGAIVGKQKGIRFEFHINEKDIHHKPHIHCSYNGSECRIRIDTLELLDKPLPSQKMKEAIEFVSRNKKFLLYYWKKVVIKGEFIKFKIEYNKKGKCTPFFDSIGLDLFKEDD